MGIAKEITDSLDTMRIQQNVDREFKKQASTGITSGCISGDKVSIGEFVWRVYHSLGREPIGFIIMEQGSTTSLKAEMSNMNLETVEIKFSADPTSFTLFFY